ncbi:LOW QUALITY PROTEIN: testis-specific serine/threonine-protein kinase 2 [Erethizon dorsatum]
MASKGYFMGIMGKCFYAKIKSAYTEHLKFSVVVKIIHCKKILTSFVRFLPQEMDILATINHCAIIKTYEIFETSNVHIDIIVELSTLGNLLEFIKHQGTLHDDTPHKMFCLSLAFRYCCDLDIIHRDLKCKNVFLYKDFNIELSNLGSKCCLWEGSQHIVLSESYCRSAAYVAPDVLQGTSYQPGVYGIWSLGMILYIMVWVCMPCDDSNIKKMLCMMRKEHCMNFPPCPKNLSGESHLIYGILQPDVSWQQHSKSSVTCSCSLPNSNLYGSSNSLKRGEGNYWACRYNTRPGSRTEHWRHKQGAKTQHRRLLEVPENKDCVEARLAVTSTAKENLICRPEVGKLST